MASIIYDSFMDDLIKGNFNFDDDYFYVMLVTDQYQPNKGLHTRRSDITPGQVGTSGTAYTTGGKPTTPTPLLNTTEHRLDIGFSNVTWSAATITAKAAVIYKLEAGDNGLPGTPLDDRLVAYVDFGQNVSSTAAAFAVTFSSALRLQN